MRHGKSGRKLNRSTSHRVAMFRNMVTSLLEHERIVTTVPKAKEIRRWADWMITLGKRGDLHARRQALAVIREKQVVHKVFDDLGPRYQNRSGGYTRMVKAGFRRGDASPMCILELMTDSPGAPKKAKQVPQTGQVERAASVQAGREQSGKPAEQTPSAAVTEE
ncbi:50S ribosomal protein L17 [Desulfoferrobacter suflitae]|uniref:50S ribosomal protein L17 n=1 Tax=Desulfoferrobacter suflitae TaxID=2865782 RepID=UPI0021648B9B